MGTFTLGSGLGLLFVGIVAMAVIGFVGLRGHVVAWSVILEVHREWSILGSSGHSGNFGDPGFPGAFRDPGGSGEAGKYGNSEYPKLLRPSWISFLSFFEFTSREQRDSQRKGPNLCFCGLA